LKITDVESIAAGAAQSLNREGFAILEDVATSVEIAAVARVQSLAGLKTRELWERGSAPQIVEVEDVLELSPEQ